MHCWTCGRSIVAHAPRVRYCSNTCRAERQAKLHRRWTSQYRVLHPRGTVLRRRDAIAIAKLYDEGVGVRDLAWRYHTHVSTIAAIIDGDTWGHVTGRSPDD